MGAFNYIKASFEKTFKERPDFYRKRLTQWRAETSVKRVEGPTNPLRARELGYKATKDYIIVRVKTKRGKRTRPRPDLGRKPAKNRLKENPSKPWSWTAGKKAERKFPNMRLINAYLVGKDGSNQYFEVIMKTKN